MTALILLGKNGLNQSHSNEKEKEKGSIHEMETFLVVQMEDGNDFCSVSCPSNQKPTVILKTCKKDS